MVVVVEVVLVVVVEEMIHVAPNGDLKPDFHRWILTLVAALDLTWLYYRRLWQPCSEFRNFGYCVSPCS